MKVNLSLGDALYWFDRRVTFFRGPFESWPNFFGEFLECNNITDVIYYGDSLPYHLAALRASKKRDIPVWNIENGYLRPDWITLEADGTNASQQFMKHLLSYPPGVSESESADLGVRYTHSFGTLAWHEATFSIANFLGNLVRITGYNDGRYYHPLGELLPWLIRPLTNSRVNSAARTFHPAHFGKPYFLAALQLQNDFQIHNHSRFGHISQMLDETINSFARHASNQTQLVIKLHPHDNGYERWDRVAEEFARQTGVSDRVTTLIGGNLEELLSHASGLITINSTVGLQSLRQRTPTIALGNAIYDLAGLTHQNGLDSFWKAPQNVDPELLKRFISGLSKRLQVKGDFYDPAGRAAAILEIVARVTDSDPLTSKA